MREIKFRQLVNNKFHYWGFLSEGSFIGVMPPIDKALKYSQQFTGVVYSGKELYEGDIVQLKFEHGFDDNDNPIYKTENYPIRFDEESGGFVIDWKEEFDKIAIGYAFDYIDNAGYSDLTINILSSIHENGDLLK